jgi:hypothetical protein
VWLQRYKERFCDARHIAGAATALEQFIHTREDSDGQIGSRHVAVV